MRLGELSIALAGWLLAGCAALAPSPAPWPVPPAALGERLAEQRLVLTRQGGHHALEAVVQVRADRLRIIGNALALRLFTLDYDGRRISQGPGAGLPAGLTPARIVNDFLAVHTPLAALRQALPAGWQADEAAGVRTVRNAQGAVELVVRYRDGDPWHGATLQALSGGYRLAIESEDVR
ncbi:DUF3261 domain-containing protein [Chitiniphilus purpureus]|uniref:DUF3261 domain-containing protein n=1 Tax=Chitiniphilus purpureus TaxID=2981137 RepID=A0ABY6DNP4_9NEIS|nr:DUF3261 domain-containing protein [Chitiniphilus sp. CD1]UXY15999.1 DUF3261 domain-containing protein [Chitiniphilus sp. CD1]